MRSQLPKIFVELTTVRLIDNDVVKEENSLLLLDALNPDSVRGINEQSDSVWFEFLGEGIIDELPRVVNIKFLNTESDQYQEFITSVDFADMQRSIAKLSKVVYCEFEAILKRCPENYESLFKQLELHVLSK